MSIAFERLIQGFLDSGSRSGMTENTIRNYRSDLRSLMQFIEEAQFDFQSLGLQELTAYLTHLQALGLKPNSQRRKIMTAKTFLKAVSHQIDVSLVGAEKIVPPEKIEKPPQLVPLDIIEHIRSAQSETPLGLRNRALLGVMLDTGALVTEVLALKQEDIHWEGDQGARLTITGGRSRAVRVSHRTARDVSRLIESLTERHHGVFYGYHKGGPHAERLTARGVEVLFKNWSKLHDQSALKPRVMRHLFVMACYREGKSEPEIMGLLGLRTPYIFKIYRPLHQEEIAAHAQRDAEAATGASAL